MGFRDQSGDIESESCAAGLPGSRRITAKKWLANMLDLLWRESWAMVFYLDDQVTLLHGRLQDDGTGC